MAVMHREKIDKLEFVAGILLAIFLVGSWLGFGFLVVWLWLGLLL